MSGNTSRRYPPELRVRAVRMFGEVRGQHESEWTAMAAVTELVGVGMPETVRKWVRQAEIDEGSRAGVTSEKSAELDRPYGDRGVHAARRSVKAGEVY